MLIKENINFKRRTDLETKGTSTIWIQLVSQGQKPILVQGLYRQFKRLTPDDTSSMKMSDREVGT